MKKKLEADLVSIAHRILQLKNKTDIDQLYLESQKLYEKLALLRFVEAHFGESKPTIGLVEIEQQIEKAWETNQTPLADNLKKEALPVLENSTIVETVLIEKETLEKTTLEKPLFELETEENQVDTTPKPEVVPISFEELIGGNFNEDLFIKAENNSVEIPAFSHPSFVSNNKNELQKDLKEVVKGTSLNEKLSKGIQIDLNDRIAFTKHLFGNQPQDYIRVMNQILTFDTYAETLKFIQEMVKPDYNNWEGKPEYEERFMEIIEKKFL